MLEAGRDGPLLFCGEERISFYGNLRNDVFSTVISVTIRF